MKKHKILDSNTILGYILVNILYVILIYFGLLNIFSGIIYLLGVGEELATVIGMILAGILSFIIFKLWFRGEFDGFYGSPRNGLGMGESFVTGLKDGCIFFLYMIFIVLLGLIFGKLQGPSIAILLSSMSAGIGEEIMFRAFPLAYLMRRVKTRKGLLAAMIVTALVFGLIHLANITSGAGVTISIFQAFGATCMGLIFAFVYLRSGNILACMLLHTFTDFACFLDVSQVSAEGIQIATHLTIANYFDLVFMFVFLIYIVVRLRKPGQLDEILAFWDKKWNKTEK